MKVAIGAVILFAVAAAALWMAGIFGGQTVLGTSWLNGRSSEGAVVGASVIIVIGEGGVPAGLAPGASVTIGSLDTGEAYCQATIVQEIDTPDGPGYSTECTGGL